MLDSHFCYQLSVTINKTFAKAKSLALWVNDTCLVTNDNDSVKITLIILLKFALLGADGWGEWLRMMTNNK